jgi:V/A-type H+/Na+-transporting ATPase subunit E
MGLDDVKKAIEEKTKAEVTAKQQAAQAESSRIINEAKEQIKQKQTEHSVKTKELIEALERKEHAAAQFARKTVVLDEKRKGIDAVYNETLDAVRKLPADERNKLLSALAGGAANAITIGTVRCNSKDVQAIGKLFKEAKVVADDNINGGFIADDQDGTVRIDYTYETLLEQVREERMGEITQILFDEKR